jgi:hypothetical protein
LTFELAHISLKNEKELERRTTIIADLMSQFDDDEERETLLNM